MAIFSYKARDGRGKMVEGMVEAQTVESVASLLTEKGFTVINVEVRKLDEVAKYYSSIFKRVKIKELLVFFRQLSIMIRANLPIVKVLQILTKQTTNPHFKTVIASIANEVDGGAKLSAAMASFPNIFSGFQASVIRSGETSGRLSEVVDYLADQQEKDYDLQAQIRGAMIYPIFIIIGLFAVGFVVMTFVMPQMTTMLLEAGVTLPLTTRLLIFISDIFKNYWLIILIVIFAVIAGGFYGVKMTRGGRIFWDKFKLRVPIFGKIFEKIYIVRISRSFGTLLAGGVPIARALEVIREVVGNEVYKTILTVAMRDVEEGNPISESFMGHKEFPIMVPQMMSVGEETGRLDEVLEKITDFYSREIDYSVKNLSTLIEPVIMVILGVAVGFFIAAIILPMWQLAGAM